MNADRLTLRIEAPHFTAGVLLDPETQFVTHAAPIVSYMVGWTRARVEAYCAAKRWTYKVTHGHPQENLEA